MPDFTKRAKQVELMDDLESDVEKLERTLSQFSSINRSLTRSRFLLKKHALRPLKKVSDRKVKVLDVGSGGGDVALAIHKLLSKAGIPHEIDCLDRDPRCIAFAKRKLGENPVFNFLEMDLLDKRLKGLNYDLVYAGHFLHHIDEKEMKAVVGRLAHLCRRVLLINDLERSRFSYYAFDLLARLFYRRSFARWDGKISVLKGFSKKELDHMAEWVRQQGMDTLSYTLFPGRQVIAAQRPALFEMRATMSSSD